jgi:two-component system OmpR family sensor kinase
VKALSITARVILTYSAVFGVVLAGFGVIIYRSSRAAEIVTLDVRLEQYAALIESEIDEGPNEESVLDPGALRGVRPEGLTGARLQILGPGDAVAIADSLLRLLPHDPRSGAVGRRIAVIGDAEYRIMWKPLEREDHAQYILEVAAPMSEAEGRLARLRLLLLAAIPASLCLTGIAAFFITRNALRPIAAMTDTARSLTAANLERRIPVPRAHDEVRVLAQTLNEMIERIDAALRSQRQFVADASHELRTPLTIITTELEYAEKRADGAVQESVRVALTEVDRLSRLTEGLLLLARLHAPQTDRQRQEVHLDDLLGECVHHMNGTAEAKRITVRLEKREPQTVEGDRERLKSVVLNLLDNAILYSAEGTTVRVELCPGDREKGQAAIIISDEGYGISAEDLGHIFQRFYRGSTARTNDNGSGLGLAIAERIVHMHGGSIEVSSTPGKGSTFTVRLPLHHFA